MYRSVVSTFKTIAVSVHAAKERRTEHHITGATSWNYRWSTRFLPLGTLKEMSRVLVVRGRQTIQNEHDDRGANQIAAEAPTRTAQVSVRFIADPKSEHRSGQRRFPRPVLQHRCRRWTSFCSLVSIPRLRTSLSGHLPHRQRSSQAVAEISLPQQPKPE